MSDLKPVEYKILSIIEDRGVARVRFINPYRDSDADTINVDVERDVAIPFDEATGEADADEFKTRLDQHCLAQSNKMLIASKKTNKTGNAFSSILKMDKNIEVVKPTSPTKPIMTDGTEVKSPPKKKIVSKKKTSAK
jgi:hypothetical protein